jgi:magnesium-transporting ATPase (P-type)
VGITAVLQPESGQTIRDLVEADLQVKMLSVDAPEEAARTALDLGLPGERLSLFSGNAWEGSDQHEIKRSIQAGNVFGDLVPSQKAALIDMLRSMGERVLMIGNTVSDVPAMQMANLRIALRNSAQAAVKITDIVLLKDSLEALPHVLITGQRLVNGILDLFKLYLSQTIAQLLLVLTILLFGLIQFPYHPTQAGIVSLFTIALPAMFLSVWAAAGRVTSSGIRRQLAHFIIPSAITLALLTWGVYLLFFSRYHNVEYAQLAVTYALLIAGWLRVLFVQPPASIWVGGAPLRGDRRVAIVVLGSVLLFLVIISIPFFQEIMRITWLQSGVDYLFVLLLSAVWALITRTIWRSKWLEKLVNKL